MFQQFWNMTCIRKGQFDKVRIEWKQEKHKLLDGLFISGEGKKLLFSTLDKTLSKCYKVLCHNAPNKLKQK